LIAVDKLTSWELGLSPDQMREVDRLAEAEYGITPLQLMEVAGLQTARVAREMVGARLAGRAVCILTGKGNNGGDGLVAARRLAAWGARVTAITSYPPAEAQGLSLAQVRSADAAGVACGAWQGALPSPCDLYVDALLGFGASGAPRGAVAEMIASLATANGPVLAVDLPSGLDGATGEVAGACVKAGSTVTLGVPKVGMLAAAARELVGDLYVADIGIPPSLLRRVGVDPAGLFEEGDLVRLGPIRHTATVEPSDGTE
jgi:NAD(P)H-hydrate epimerase